MGKLRHFLILCGTILVFICQPLLSQSQIDAPLSLDKAISYYMGISSEVDFFKGRDTLVQLQENGDPLAGFFCGINYYTGSFAFAFDPGKGVSLCDRYSEPVQHRAEEGDKFACMLLGMAFYYGLGVEENPLTAEKWLQKSAEKKNAIGMLQYAKFLEKRNEEEQAFKLYQELKNINCLWGDVGGGVCLLYGKGCYPDQESGFGILKAAAEKNFPPAMGWLGLCYERGYGIEKDVTIAQQWYEKGLKLGDEISGGLLGSIYEMGTGVERDFPKAIEIYQQAVNIGSEDALIQQVWFYFYNKDMKDYEKAFALAERGIKAKFLLRAYTCLGWLYYDDESPRKNYQKAFENFYYASQRGDSDAVMSLAGMYEAGLGVEEDVEKAEFYYRLAAQNGQPMPSASLASFLFRMNKQIPHAHELTKEAYIRLSTAPTIRSAYGWSLCKQGKYEEARKQLEEIKDILDYNGTKLPGVYYELSAMVYEGQGEKSKALELYKMALKRIREEEGLIKKQEADLLEAIKRLE